MLEQRTSLLALEIASPANLQINIRHSLLSCKSKHQNKQQRRQTLLANQPFGGKSWNGVYIRRDDDHYIYVINDRLTKWDFRGFEPTDCEYDSKDAKVVFTDDACYARNRDTVVKYPMNGGSKKTTVMKNMIKRITASQTGFATLTDDGFITLFDTKSNPKGNVHLRTLLGRTPACEALNPCPSPPGCQWQEQSGLRRDLLGSTACGNRLELSHRQKAIPCPSLERRVFQPTPGADRVHNHLGFFADRDRSLPSLRLYP